MGLLFIISSTWIPRFDFLYLMINSQEILQTFKIPWGQVALDSIIHSDGWRDYDWAGGQGVQKAWG